MTRQEKIQDLLDQMGVEETISDHSQVQVEQKPGNDYKDSAGRDSRVETETLEVTVFQPIDPNENTENIRRKALMEDGRQIVLDIRKRPKCPSCHYIPSEEDDPGHLTGKCSDCGISVCGQCKNECEACGTILCNDCTQGHGAVNQTYCEGCLHDVQQEIEFNRRTELVDKKHQQQLDEQEIEMERLENQHQRRLEMKKLEQQIAEAHHSQLMELKKLQKELQENQHSQYIDLKELQKTLKDGRQERHQTRQDKQFDKRLKAEKFKLKLLKEIHRQREGETSRREEEKGPIQQIQDRVEQIQNHPAYQNNRNSGDNTNIDL